MNATETRKVITLLTKFCLSFCSAAIFRTNHHFPKICGSIISIYYLTFLFVCSHNPTPSWIRVLETELLIGYFAVMVKVYWTGEEMMGSDLNWLLVTFIALVAHRIVLWFHHKAEQQKLEQYRLNPEAATD
ncbi:hypothetical protein GCK72_008962 [Caenorhabditis remanei]|uniref:Uncharacterized protein n=1 Tax=Caenorhabditis remanei TaxID=31234 RepID=A0A6A5H292_CAERE|nr:hypothetical protein GCK72_008962 [Caenorhabditis remanei]KAF1760713.1 hypothetical protein GCK72_008962 [Caenorhabditis remanei]